MPKEEQRPGRTLRRRKGFKNIIRDMTEKKETSKPASPVKLPPAIAFSKMETI